MTSRSGVLGVQLAGWGWVGKGVQGVADGFFFVCICVKHCLRAACFHLKCNIFAASWRFFHIIRPRWRP